MISFGVDIHAVLGGVTIIITVNNNFIQLFHARIHACLDGDQEVSV